MRPAFLALILSVALAPLAAQEPEAPRPGPPFPIQGAQPDDLQRQIAELFGKVERDLRAIDSLLQEAAREQSAAGAGAEAGLAGRLRDAQERGQSVTRDIDRILELAAQQSPSSSGGQSSGESQSDGQGSPLDGQGEQSTGRESTPSTPAGEPGGEEQQPGGQEPRPGQEEGQRPRDGQRPGEQGRDPRDGPQSSAADPRQQPGADPARGARGGANDRGEGRDRWGDLPVHAREVFRNEGGQDMPPLYREWIDAYYKRLNRQP
jgi:hypothetical protein